MLPFRSWLVLAILVVLSPSWPSRLMAEWETVDREQLSDIGGLLLGENLFRVEELQPWMEDILFGVEGLNESFDNAEADLESIRSMLESMTGAISPPSELDTDRPNTGTNNGHKATIQAAPKNLSWTIPDSKVNKSTPSFTTSGSPPNWSFTVNMSTINSFFGTSLAGVSFSPNWEYYEHFRGYIHGVLIVLATFATGLKLFEELRIQ